MSVDSLILKSLMQWYGACLNRLEQPFPGNGSPFGFSFRLHLKESKLALERSEASFASILKNESIWTAEPERARSLNTVDEFGASDDATILELGALRIGFDPSLTADAQKVFVVVFRDGLQASMDPNPATMICWPSTVFDVFVTVDDQPCPRLSNSECFGHFHSSRLVVVIWLSVPCSMSRRVERLISLSIEELQTRTIRGTVDPHSESGFIVEPNDWFHGVVTTGLEVDAAVLSSVEE